MAIDATSVKDMTQYLHFAVEFEKQVYIWESATSDINRRMQNLSEQQAHLSNEEYNLFALTKRYEAQRDSQPQRKTFSLFGRRKTAQNDRQKNEQVLHARKEALLRSRQTLAKKEASLQATQKTISLQLQKAKRNLGDLYALNILPVKYRSFNAVSTLYEYLSVGRCITIQGHGGIYDTYENDLRLGLIIQTLSEIRDSLQRIEANQQLLYRELQQANRTLDNIKTSLQEIEKTNAEIAENTAISAAANQQTAAAAQYLAWKASYY